MENPMTWGPVQHCIADHLDRSSTELVAILDEAKLLPASVNRILLARKFDEEILKFQKQVEKGFCGISLPTHLANMIG